MTDPIAPATIATAAAQSAATAAQTAQATPQATFAPMETRMFATLMQGAPNLAPASAGAGVFNEVAASLTSRLGQTRTFEEIRHSMLSSFDPADPIKSMFVMTSDGMEAQMLFTRLHISTSLASAATSLFGGLLKNQQ